MVNVLLNVYDFDADWAYDKLKWILRPTDTVTIITMSHGDEIPDAETWESLYNPGCEINNIFARAYGAYGIEPEQIQYISWYHDDPESAAQKLFDSDVVFMTGGLPDLFYERMQEMGIADIIRAFPGVVMGCSAGAMVQMAEYHITPDEDYDHYQYAEGLGLLDGFEPEVHFRGSDVQWDSIRRYQAERGKPVYATENSGGLLVCGDDIITMGDVHYVPVSED